MNVRTTISGARRRHSSTRRRPVGVRTGAYLASAAAGLVLATAIVGSEVAPRADAVGAGAVSAEPAPSAPVDSRSGSVAGQLGIDATPAPDDVADRLEPLQELAASRSSREEAAAVAGLAQVAADRAVLDQQRAEADAAARRAAEEAAGMKAAAAFAAAEAEAGMKAAAAFAAAEAEAGMKAAAAIAAAEAEAGMKAAAAIAAAEEAAARPVAPAAAPPAPAPAAAPAPAPRAPAPPAPRAAAAPAPRAAAAPAPRVPAPPVAAAPAAPVLPAAAPAARGVARITNNAGAIRPQVQAAANAVVSNVPGAGSITLGGTRASAADPGGHPSGLALDYMVLSNRALGNAITAYHIAHWDELGVDYIIWEQRYLGSPGGAWKQMENRGSVTANHFDHVHVNYR